MKNLDLKKQIKNFSGYVLSNDDMLRIRGGEGEPVILPPIPTVKI